MFGFNFPVSNEAFFKGSLPKHGFDDLQIDWTSQEKRELASACVLKLLTAGVRESGKSSLLLSLMSMQSNLTGGPEDRTIVAEYRSWKLRSGKTVPVFDIGGHPSYLYTAHLFHNNVEHNGVLLCHDIMSDNFRKSFEWLQNIVIRSPLAHVIPVLTKADRKVMGEEKILERKEQFKNEMVELIRKEVKSLEIQIEYGCGSSSRSSSIRGIISKYKNFIEDLNEHIYVTSSKEYAGLEDLLAHIENLADRMVTKIDKRYVDLFVKLGKVGIKVEKEEMLDTSCIIKLQILN